jgi:hypothetical protein
MLRQGKGLELGSGQQSAVSQKEEKRGLRSLADG